MHKRFDVALEIDCTEWEDHLTQDLFSAEVCDFLNQNLDCLYPPDPRGRVWQIAEEIGISLVLSDDAYVQSLNKTYRHKDKPTNVLSFAQLDDLAIYPDEALGEIALGDIIIAYQTIVREAEIQKKTVQDHLKHMILHGVLHLLGYDHMSDDEARLMESREIALLAHWGVKNPYETDEL